MARPDQPSGLKGHIMAVPKRKMSRSNTRHRRSAWKANAVATVPIVVDGQTYRVPRSLVRAVHQGLIDPGTGKILTKAGS
jgi:large subunit ribosomal protein L32